MADNYLERQYADYIARRAAAERKKKLRWKKALKEYMAKQKPGQEPAPSSAEEK